MQNLTLKSINEIGLDTHFIIPSYQRGYRWNQTQVINLLEDIQEFIETKNHDSFYCLQPVVVRKDDQQHFEVIDGQQRLTTIAILLHYLGQRSYTLQYETRPESQKLLQQLNQDTSAPTNVDHHYFKQAYDTIKAWFEPQLNTEPTLALEFYITLGKQVKVIWYEVDASVEAYDLFMRLNIGKIELTNAELIKAALLHKRDSHERLELALEWEQMEQALQDDDFWYFLNPHYDYTNRLEFLFDLIANNLPKHHDAYFTFYQMMKSENFTFWSRTRQLFARLEEWYHDRTLYHLIGYVLHRRNQLSLNDLLNKYDSPSIESKQDFITYLKQEVRSTLPSSLSQIRELSYANSSDHTKIHNTLLLFNILEEIQSERAIHRFPFSHYVKEDWSLEHIHAQKTETLSTMNQWRAWLADAHVLKETLQVTMDKPLFSTLLERQTFKREEFDQAVVQFEEAIRQHSATQETTILIDGDALHSFGNLALLDQSLNTTLGNHYYSIKFAKLKQHERNGGYVPPATRNVFWKYYSDQPSQHQYWSLDDRQDYVEYVVQSLARYFKEEQ